MKKRKLTFKFTLMFTAFTLLTLVISSILSFLNQTNLYKNQREESIQYIANYLESRVVADGIDFLNFQKYFVPRSGEFRIKPDFDQESVERDRALYETLFAQAYPGKALDYDINFDDLPEEIKKIYTIYSYKYYTLMFEEAAKAFNIKYAYYVTPVPDVESMYWTIFNVREPVEIDGEQYLLLNEIIGNTHKNNPQMWEAWDTGKRPKGYKVYNNKYGKTYAYYTPLFINGKKLGVIGVEVEIDAVNKAILQATIKQMLMIGGVLVLFMQFLLFLIRSQYIRKLTKLSNIIDEYSEKKNPKIAELLKKEVTNEDEISSIMTKFADMIYELELYIQNLTKTKQALQDTRQQAIELNELAMKDALTGIRNKTGYDKEVQKIEWEMASGLKKIGVAMIDLNFLKRINDTYGHDKGNIAIVSLSRMLCHIFEHSPVFRIGGDEFVVILKGHDLENIDELVTEFNWQLKQAHDNPTLEYWEKISAAIGYAIYNPEIDSAYENIFKRADAEMYKNKKAMKAVREE